MKVNVTDFEADLVLFLKKLVGTMPTTGHKFLAGAMLTASAKRVEDLVLSVAEEGMVDLDRLKTLADSGFLSSDGKASFTLGEGTAWLLKPVTVTVTREDVEEFLRESGQRHGHA